MVITSVCQDWTPSRSSPGHGYVPYSVAPYRKWSPWGSAPEAFRRSPAPGRLDGLTGPRCPAACRWLYNGCNNSVRATRDVQEYAILCSRLLALSSSCPRTRRSVRLYPQPSTSACMMTLLTLTASPSARLKTFDPVTWELSTRIT